MQKRDKERVVSELVERESSGRVVRGDHRAGADADEDIDLDAFAHQRAQHTDVRGAAKAAGAEDERDARLSDRRFRQLHHDVRSAEAFYVERAAEAFARRRTLG